ncbi:MAG: ABC transporter permease [Gaiellaceae bacterium]
MTETKLRARPAPPSGKAPVEEGSARAKPIFVIRPASRLPRLDFAELWHFRELLGTFVWRDVRVRYKQTFLGVAWSLLVPLFTAAVYVVIFGKFAKFPSGTKPYPLLVFAGLLPMQCFSSALNGSSVSLVTNAALVTKVYFPRVLLPLAAVLVPVVDFALGMLVLVGLMAKYNNWPKLPEVFLAPVFVLLALVTALGAGFLLSALNTRYRDVPYAIPVFMQVLPFVSAVPYALNEVPLKWQWILSINPITTVVTGWRWCVIGGAPPKPEMALLSVGVALLLLLGGLAFFRASEPRFADTI